MKKLLLLIIVILLFVSISSAAPPFVATSQGLSIEPTLVQYLPIGQNYTFNIHVFNDTSGLPITDGNTLCYMNLYNQIGIHSMQATQSAAATGDFDFVFFANAQNFSKKGNYNVKFQCNNSVVGGSIEMDIEVNQLGTAFTTAKSLAYLAAIMISFIIFLGFFIAGIVLPSGNKSDAMTGYVLAVSNLKYVKLFSLALSYMALLIFFFLSWMFALIAFDSMVTSIIFQWIFYIMAVAAFPLFILGVYLLITNWIRDNKLADFLSRGLSIKG